ncbi:MAG: hypothetical protein HY323_08065 [Betaproteobacteria bacterium]|nr:hypothetical protein [Betaproteobacteria bacterium]
MTDSVRTAYAHQNRTSTANDRRAVWPPYEWGMVENAQGAQAPGVHHAQPLIDSWRWIRAQIGTRPVQAQASPSAGQSESQRSGTLGTRSAFQAEVDAFQTGPEVIKIARFFRAANTGYEGVNSVGRAIPGNLAASGDNVTVMKKPLQRFPTRGPRSISGAMNRKSRWDDTGRQPSVFVPTAPLR